MGMINRGMRNAFRNGVRTIGIVIILALSIGLSLTMYLADQAVDTRIDSVKQSIGTAITISPAGTMGFAGGGEPLAADSADKIEQLGHVSSISEKLTAQLTTDTDTNLKSGIEPGSIGGRGGGSAPGGGQAGPAGGLPIFATGGTDITSVQQGGNQTPKVTSGSFDGKSDSKTAVVGKDIASKNNLSVGSSFQAYGQTITVSGIYESGNRFADNGVLFPLETLRTLSNQPGESTEITVKANSVENADALAGSIQSALGDSAQVTTPSDRSSDAIQPLTSIKNITTWSMIGALVAGAVIIFLTMLMIVRERRREIGVLKAIGASNQNVVGQFISEALTFTGLAAVFGVVLGVIFSNNVTKALVASSSTTPGGSGGGPPRGGGGPGMLTGGPGGALGNLQTAIGIDVVLYALAAIIIIALVGSAIPAWLIAKVRPAEVMRQE